MDDWSEDFLDLSGRDIFSPAGAHLARGDDWTKAGPPVDVAKLVRLDIRTAMVDDAGLHGEVIGTDGPFGNIVLNVPAETFAKLGYKVVIRSRCRWGERRTICRS